MSGHEYHMAPGTARPADYAKTGLNWSALRFVLCKLEWRSFTPSNGPALQVVFIAQTKQLSLMGLLYPGVAK